MPLSLALCCGAGSTAQARKIQARHPRPLSTPRPRPSPSSPPSLRSASSCASRPERTRRVSSAYTPARSERGGGVGSCQRRCTVACRGRSGYDCAAAPPEVAAQQRKQEKKKLKRRSGSCGCDKYRGTPPPLRAPPRRQVEASKCGAQIAEGRPRLKPPNSPEIVAFPPDVCVVCVRLYAPATIESPHASARLFFLFASFPSRLTVTRVRLRGGVFFPGSWK